MSDPDRSNLAINGGEPACRTPWPERCLITQEEKAAVVALFDKTIAAGSDLTYNGEEEEAYCREFAESLGGGYADAVNSGTNALYVALRALEIEPFTEVICPPVTDAGGVMPVPIVGCIPVIADGAPGSYNGGPDEIEARITDRTSAIVVAHLAGLPADMDPIMEIARARGIPVIEDCAQSHGARYKGRAVGAIGDVACFSTMGGKQHCTGAQGGVVFTRDEGLYWRCRRYSDRGKPFGLEGEAQNVVCSLNCNLNDLSAVIGRAQLRRLPGIVAGRRRGALNLAEGCRSLEAVSLVTEPPGVENSFWRLFFKLELDKLCVDKVTFVKALSAEGVSAGTSYYHVFTTYPWYKDRAVFGTSGYPWTSPEYTGDPDQDYLVPNLDATEATHFRMYFHENFSDEKLQEILAALAKVEKAFLK